MKKHKFFIFTIYLSIIISFFDTPHIMARTSGNTPFDRMDSDGDGKLSQSEFTGPSRGFKNIDKNNDGFISKSEMKEFRQGKSQTIQTTTTTPSVPLTYIDTHNHLIGHFSKQNITDYVGAAEVALVTMNSQGIQKMIIMPMPQAPNQDQTLHYSVLLDVVNKYPDRFGFLGGGGTLNPMIQEAIQKGVVTDKTKEEFKKQALEILAKGALGFGEMTAEHVSMNPTHVYEAAPPDHPLFLLLADIAAEHNVPIDLHMEAVPNDMPTPPKLLSRSPLNPKQLKANIKNLENLLQHNGKAKIIWVHTGWDNTGNWTPQLCGQLLKNHSNLYMSFRVVSNKNQINRPIDDQGNITSEWLNLIKAYPDRFMFGSDEFFFPSNINKSHASTGSVKSTIAFLNKLPEDLRRKVGYENAIQVFNLQP